MILKIFIVLYKEICDFLKFLHRMFFIVYICMLALGHGEKLPSGQHNFPFQFMLPPTLPSSFEHQYGQVRYMLKATIDKPWKFDHHTKLPFTVVSLLDLNAIPEAPVTLLYIF